MTGILRARASTTSGLAAETAELVDDRGSGDVGRIMAFVDRCAHLGEAVGDRTASQIGARDLEAKVEQDLGDAAHADSADADEVRVL